MRSTASGSSGVIVGRIRPPTSSSSATSFPGRRRSRFHQCTKSPEPQSRHLLTPSESRFTDRIEPYGIRLAPHR